MAIETGGTEWHQSNRGVSIYICAYLFLFVLVVILSVSRLFAHGQNEPSYGSMLLLFSTVLFFSPTETPP